jgi:hypothetical protein
VSEMLGQLAEMMASLPPLPPRRTLHCHPSVTAALAAVAPEPEPEPSWMGLGRIGDLCGIDVYGEPEMMPGAWEIREGGTLVNFGVLRSAK